jgi:hypothetical protein
MCFGLYQAGLLWSGPKLSASREECYLAVAIWKPPVFPLVRLGLSVTSTRSSRLHGFIILP